MSGPDRCFECANKFGFFKKQHDCKKCQRTACKGCLSYNVVLPGLGPMPQPVCKSCYNANQSKPSHSGRVSPPANFKRELARKQEIKDKESVTPAVDPADERIMERLEKLKKSCDRKDLTVDEIEDRLQKLCSAEPNMTMEELEYRLAKLKGERPPAIRVHSIRKRPSDNEPHSSKETGSSEAKQVKRLIRQYTEEILMEEQKNPYTDSSENFHPEVIPENPSSDDLIELARSELRREQEEEKEGMIIDEKIMNRLSQLTAAPAVKESVLEDFDTSGIDEESSHLIRKLLEEDRLEYNLVEQGITVAPRTSRSSAKGGNSFTRNHKANEADTEEEFPWCFMCNDDAIIRCITCEDLFCKTCFRISHKDSDMKGHKTEKFVGKNVDI
ncbi:abscission/NoCut checkpoint regulator-like [Clavelina lepadiformis]|uniref:abscission/NoCut checkpoint regulator-like n=1 Tax=Clavelina lepadiformis TaxID=159417 RepID=UPI0040422F2E